MPMSGGGTIRRLLPFTTVALVIALVYVGWIFFSRWQANRNVAAVRREKTQREAAADQRVLQQLGGNELKILSFSAEPGVVRPGGRVLFCYGVLNAASVHIDPHMEDLAPALSQCFYGHPRRTTDYTITAQNKAGHSVSARLLVRVAR